MTRLLLIALMMGVGCGGEAEVESTLCQDGDIQEIRFSSVTHNWGEWKSTCTVVKQDDRYFMVRCTRLNGGHNGR